MPEEDDINSLNDVKTPVSTSFQNTLPSITIGVAFKNGIYINSLIAAGLTKDAQDTKIKVSPGELIEIYGGGLSNYNEIFLRQNLQKLQVLELKNNGNSITFKIPHIKDSYASLVLIFQSKGNPQNNARLKNIFKFSKEKEEDKEEKKHGQGTAGAEQDRQKAGHGFFQKIDPTTLMSLSMQETLKMVGKAVTEQKTKAEKKKKPEAKKALDQKPKTEAKAKESLDEDFDEDGLLLEEIIEDTKSTIKNANNAQDFLGEFLDKNRAPELRDVKIKQEILEALKTKDFSKLSLQGRNALLQFLNSPITGLTEKEQLDLKTACFLVQEHLNLTANAFHFNQTAKYIDENREDLVKAGVTEENLLAIEDALKSGDVANLSLDQQAILENQIQTKQSSELVRNFLIDNPSIIPSAKINSEILLTLKNGGNLKNLSEEAKAVLTGSVQSSINAQTGEQGEVLNSAFNVVLKSSSDSTRVGVTTDKQTDANVTVQGNIKEEITATKTGDQAQTTPQPQTEELSVKQNAQIVGEFLQNNKNNFKGQEGLRSRQAVEVQDKILNSLSQAKTGGDLITEKLKGNDAEDGKKINGSLKLTLEELAKNKNVDPKISGAAKNLLAQINSAQTASLEQKTKPEKKLPAQEKPDEIKTTAEQKITDNDQEKKDGDNKEQVSNLPKIPQDQAQNRQIQDETGKANKDQEKKVPEPQAGKPIKSKQTADLNIQNIPKGAQEVLARLSSAPNIFKAQAHGPKIKPTSPKNLDAAGKGTANSEDAINKNATSTQNLNQNPERAKTENPEENKAATQPNKSTSTNVDSTSSPQPQTSAPVLTPIGPDTLPNQIQDQDQDQDSSQTNPENLRDDNEGPKNSADNLQTGDQNLPAVPQKTEEQKKREVVEKLIAELNPFFNKALVKAAWYIWGTIISTLYFGIGFVILIVAAICGDLLFLFKKRLIKIMLKTPMAMVLMKGIKVTADDIANDIKFSRTVKLFVLSYNIAVAILIIGCILAFGLVIYVGCKTPISIGDHYELSVIGQAGYSEVCKTFMAGFNSMSDFTKGNVSPPSQSSLSGAKCQELSSGPASSQNLTNGCFGLRGNVMSVVASVESGGGNTAAESKSDVCKDGNSWSIGLFQINMIVHGANVGGDCAKIKDIFTIVNSDGKHPQGDCLNYNAQRGVCLKYDCQVKNQPLYQSCKNMLYDAKTNIDYACKISNNGLNLQPWAYTKNICNLK